MVSAMALVIVFKCWSRTLNLRKVKLICVEWGEARSLTVLSQTKASSSQINPLEKHQKSIGAAAAVREPSDGVAEWMR